MYLKKRYPQTWTFTRGEFQILWLWIILFSISFSPTKLWQLLKVKTEGCVSWKFFVRCFFFPFFLILIIKHHNWEPNYLNAIKYIETCKKSVLTVKEAFETNSSPRNIAWLCRVILHLCSAFIHPSPPIPFPIPCPHSSGLLNLFSSIMCTLISGSCGTGGCGWLDVFWLSALVCINRLFSQQAKQNTC